MSTTVTTDDLELPAFLRRQGPRLTHEQARELTMPNRTWAPFRDCSNKGPQRPSGIFVDDPSAPVTVVVRQKQGAPTLLEHYVDLAAFMAAHDVGTYPIVRTASIAGGTTVLVSAKPWAGRPSSPRQASSSSAGKSKAETIAELLTRADGCTTKEILEATGWPSVSVPAQAKSAGLALRKEKVDGVTRYYGSKA